MSVGLSEIKVVEARLGRVCPVKFTAAAGRSSNLSMTSSTAVSGSVAGVTGASESSLLFALHWIDSPEDFGDVCSGCDCDCAGCSESWGTERGSQGIGSFGWDVAVVGMPWLAIICVDEAMKRCGGGDGKASVGRGRGRFRGATKPEANSARNHVSKLLLRYHMQCPIPLACVEARRFRLLCKPTERGEVRPSDNCGHLIRVGVDLQRLCGEG